MIAARRWRSRLRAIFGRARSAGAAVWRRCRPVARRAWGFARSVGRSAWRFARFLWRLAKPPLSRVGRLLLRLARPLARLGLRLAALGERLVKWLWRRVRAAIAFTLRAAAAIDRRLRRAAAWTARQATRASAVVTPARAAVGVVVASAACLTVAQFLDYRSVEVGQPGYAGLPSIAEPPQIDARTAGEAHAYAMIPLAALAVVLALASAGGRRRRPAAGVALLGLAGIALILAVDLPAGLDEGTASIRFSGAEATLEGPFYAQLAACFGLTFGGLLLYRPRLRGTMERFRKNGSHSRARKASRSGEAGRAPTRA